MYVSINFYFSNISNFIFLIQFYFILSVKNILMTKYGMNPLSLQKIIGYVMKN